MATQLHTNQPISKVYSYIMKIPTMLDKRSRQSLKVLRQKLAAACQLVVDIYTYLPMAHGLPFSDQWIYALVVKALQPQGNVKLQAVKCEKLDENSGFMSHIVRLSLDWSVDANNNKLLYPSSLILKLLTLEKFENHLNGDENDPNAQPPPDMPDKDHLVDWMFQNESELYKIFVGKPPTFPIPKCYLVQAKTKERNGLFLLEDFTGISTTQDVMRGYSVPQLKGVAEAVAELHAWSLTNDDWKQAKFLKNSAEETNGFMTFILAKAAGLKEMYPDQFTISMDDLTRVADPVRWEKDQKDHDNILVHGDLWTNNILSDVDKATGEIGTKVLGIIDWQCTHPGSCAEDICRVLVSSFSADGRRKHEREVLQHYYDALEKKLGHKPPFTFETVEDQYYKNLQWQAMFWLNQIPLMFGMDPTKHDKTKMAEAIKRLVFAVEDAIGWMDKKN